MRKSFLFSSLSTSMEMDGTAMFFARDGPVGEVDVETCSARRQERFYLTSRSHQGVRPCHEHHSNKLTTSYLREYASHADRATITCSTVLLSSYCSF
ncbi:hypothetical protein BDZ91DRAFT_737256 [Kalaharituber pfeilii]|nr:hypothetical protein BDZ91DRAFT_737256 [Kalaharituber pfeilii]